ncbi:MAG TPA: hypothetical protein VJB87_01685 [Candidatus Nanoarchaeia archaeon]|nr:hypothetical protein [Candidatus Nanoarchaeia archaeon]
MYNVFETEGFQKIAETLDGHELKWLCKIKLKLANNPSGNILHVAWFHEKKFEGKRLYFIIDEFSKRVLLIDFSSKKEQERTIAFVRDNMVLLLEYLRSQP